MAGIRKAVVGIWGRGRRSAGGHRHSGRASRGRGRWRWAGTGRGAGRAARRLCRDQAAGLVGTPSTATGTAGEPGEAHSLVSHSSPSQPLGQKQRKASTSSIHVPPLRHGWPRQSSMSVGGGNEQGPRPARPSPGQPGQPGPRPLTLVAVGSREAAVADAGEVAPRLADAVSVGAAHAARGRRTASPGSRLQPAAIDHCGKRGVGQPAPIPAGPAHTSAGPAHTHLCRHRQGMAPWARSSSCHPCHRGTRSNSRPPGYSSGRHSGRGLARRSPCPPVGGGHREGSPALSRAGR